MDYVFFPHQVDRVVDVCLFLFFVQEIAAVLINFDRHCDWLAKEVKIR